MIVVIKTDCFAVGTSKLMIEMLLVWFMKLNLKTTKFKQLTLKFKTRLNCDYYY